MKFSQNNGVVRYDGRLVRMQIDDVWPDDDPFVVARPDLFGDAPRFVHRTGTGEVERATARPGEKRATKRPV